MVGREEDGGSGYGDVIGGIRVPSHGPMSSSPSRTDWVLALNSPIHSDSLGVAVLGARCARQRHWNKTTTANLACPIFIRVSYWSMSSVLLGQL